MSGKDENIRAALTVDGAIENALFALLRYELFAVEPDASLQDTLDHKALSELYAFAKAHDIAHLIADALLKKGWLDKTSETGKAFLNILQIAVYRYEQIRYELENVGAAFTRAKVPHLPLKGSVIRALYPEPWMRTSCDIDVYVPKDGLKDALVVLLEELGYKNPQRTSHDISTFSPTGVHFELHYDFIEDGYYPKLARVLSSVWENCSPTQENEYAYTMNEATFYFYHIAHMAKHFRNGGCGIRAFLDLYYLEKAGFADSEKAEKLLNEGGMSAFNAVCKKLARVWFEGEEHDQVTAETAKFVLGGGSYGRTENTVAAKSSGRKLRYFFLRLFPPMSEMKRRYKALKKHPWLYPVFAVRRWLNLFFVKGKAKDSAKELGFALNKDNGERVAKLLSELKLQESDLR